MSGYRIEINRALCMGSAECVATTDKVFALDADDKAIVIDAAAGTAEEIKIAVKGCPNFAIRAYPINE